MNNIKNTKSNSEKKYVKDIKIFLKKKKKKKEKSETDIKISLKKRKTKNTGIYEKIFFIT